MAQGRLIPHPVGNDSLSEAPRGRRPPWHARMIAPPTPSAFNANTHVLNVCVCVFLYTWSPWEGCWRAKHKLDWNECFFWIRSSFEKLPFEITTVSRVTAASRASGSYFFEGAPPSPCGLIFSTDCGKRYGSFHQNKAQFASPQIFCLISVSI